MKTAITTTILLTLILSGCADGDPLCSWHDWGLDCDGESDGDVGDGGMYCGPPDARGRWHCLLNDPLDDRVQDAVDQGLFIPWTSEGSCPDQGRTWDTLLAVDNLASTPARLQAAECGVSGLVETQAFSICLPEESIWPFAQHMGAIAGLPSADVWAPDCGELTPYAFAYPYEFAARCNDGVACMAFDDACACACVDGDGAPCNDMLNALDDQYFGGGSGWESVCEGAPFSWHELSQQHVGNTCIWNGLWESPSAPPELLAALDDLECYGHACAVSMATLEQVLAVPQLVTQSSSIALGSGQVEITECAHLCRALGLQVGDKISSVGRTSADPTTPGAWFDALAEFQSGSTAALITTSTHVYTLTLTQTKDDQ